MGLRLDGIFTYEEWQRLNDYAKPLGNTIYTMQLAQRCPEFNLARHRVGQCAWIKGDGRVVVSVPGLNPEERL